jgi:FtsH-binding integral membrane protein
MNETVINSTTIRGKQSFLVKTYLHLFLGLGLFGIFSGILYKVGFGIVMANLLSIQFMGFIVFGLFIAASTVAQNLAFTRSNKSIQYMGLATYALVEAIFFSPIILIVSTVPQILWLAIGITTVLFATLTLVALVSGKDFSFLKSALMYASIIVFVLILASFIWPALVSGIWFSGFMILLTGGYILYDTSNILRKFDEDQYIGASVMLLASFLLLLWYVIRFLLDLFRR